MSASYHEAGALSVPPPRAILIDVGFTLTFPDAAGIAAHAAEAGIAADAAALERAVDLLRAEIREQQGGKPVRTHDDGGVSFLEHVFGRLLALAGTPGEAAVLARAAATINRAHLRRNVWRRVGAGVPHALERMRAAGLKLAVVSNSEGTVEAMLAEQGLRPFFETVVDSAVVGLVKPDAAIFHLALDRLGVAPDAAIMVGDSPTADVFGARAAGLRAALLDPRDLSPWLGGAPRFPDLAAFTAALLT
jgi:HAD superfamily hydrolase (TIGR01509 family)